MTLTLILRMTEYHILPLSSNITLSLSGDIIIINTAFVFHDFYYYLDLFIVYVFPFLKHENLFHPFLVYFLNFSLMVLVFSVGGTSQEPYDILLTYCNPTMVLIKLFWLYLCMQLKMQKYFWSSAYSVQITFQAIFK